MIEYASLFSVLNNVMKVIDFPVIYIHMYLPEVNSVHNRLKISVDVSLLFLSSPKGTLTE